MMRLGLHLTKVSECWHFHFAADETKSHVPYEAIVPSALAPMLERYLGVHRPVLMLGERADGAEAPPIHPELDAVWVSDAGTQLEIGALARLGSSTTPDRSLAAPSHPICFATAPRLRSPSTIRNMLGMLRLF